MQSPKGTKDIYGNEMLLWRKIEDNIRNVTQIFGFEEIRTPIFEHTDLFLRGVGDTTDIVQKEMYTFLDKSNRSISLRPEQTAPVARAYIENGMSSLPSPVKFFYIGPNFRYEQTQTGRFRQHTQFGVEIFGSYNSAAEAEILSLGSTLLSRLGITNLTLHINSIGCPICRKDYYKNLSEFLQKLSDKLCYTCVQRTKTNPLRVLDCKEERCQSVLSNAPTPINSLCNNCKIHFDSLINGLTATNVDFIIDPKIVRGLDYYTRTVFEFISDNLTVIGGGRYDGLLTQLGHTQTGACGFGMGIERLAMMLENITDIKQNAPIYYIASTCEKSHIKSQEIVTMLRQKDIYAECDIVGRSLKAQMKYADKKQAKYIMVLGENELKNGTAELKNMQTGEKLIKNLEDELWLK